MFGKYLSIIGTLLLSADFIPILLRVNAIEADATNK